MRQPAVSLSGLRVGDLHPGHRSAHVHAGQTVRHAADLMSRTEADAVLVLEEGGRLAGVLTTADIVAALAGRRMRKEPMRRAAAVPIHGVARAPASAELPWSGGALSACH